MHSSKAIQKKPKPMYIPAAALNRFANELESDVSSSKFLQINRERVSEFVEKQPTYIDEASSSPTKSASNSPRSKKVPGIYDYSTAADDKSFIHLQSTPEFRSSLGPRSRFGEGDGSFFDQWLNSDVSKTKCVYDKDGFPIMKFSLNQMHNGFKKHMENHRQGVSDTTKKQYVQSYAERRELRLKKEQEEKALKEAEETTGKLPPIGGLRSPAVAAAENASHALDAFTSVDISVVADSLDGDSTKLPVIESLSAAERSNYFGIEARSTMFDYYRHLARQRFTIGDLNSDDLVEGEISAMNSARTAEENGEEGWSHGRWNRGSNSSNSPVAAGTQQLQHRQRRDGLLIDDSDASEQQSASYVTTARSGNSGNDDASQGATASEHGGNSITAPSTARSTAPSTARSRHSYSRVRDRNEPPVHGTSGTKEERRKLIEHLERQHLVGSDSSRPLSARSKFLLGCVQRGIVPQPSLIIRKHLTTMLSIPSLGIGNELAVVLAASLSSLPVLEGLNVADNNLTDKGLVPIVKALIHCQKLRILDISRNKVDTDTANALRKYLSQPGRSITQLIMQNANVDDYEASRFMLAIGQHNTVQEIDLSQNLLGSHELSLHKELDTAGVSIGALLEKTNCSLRTLKLSWNMIRFKSAVALMRSLKLNSSLTYLDISYNGLNMEGGEMLGDALHSNKQLRVLKIAHNNITSRPCCTILSGILTCKTIVEVDMSENPIGEEGARALLSVNLHHGQRVAIDIRGCSLRVKDPLCWFDALRTKNEYSLSMDQPYERCICIELLRMVARTPDYSIASFQYSAATGEAYQELELVEYSATEKQSATAATGTITGSGGVGGKQNMEEARNMFRDAANRIFHQYDIDDSGGLDREEIYNLLQQLGLEGSVALVDKLMTIYDTDGSGLVEEEEFISFLMDIKSTQDQTDMWNHTDRFVFNKVDLPRDGSKPVPYLPPDYGCVIIKLNMDSTLQTGAGGEVVSQESVEAMLSATKTLQDSSALFEYALKVMKLSFGEAQTFFRVMLKEMGSVLQVLLKLLPRMATPTDARMLIAYVTNNDFEQQHFLRSALGSAYRVYIGLPNGYYQLNLAEAVDRDCLERLSQLSNTLAAKRKRADLGDTSQHGDGFGFRNVAFEGAPFVPTREWLSNLPHKGHFECDFVALDAVTMQETEISNLKLFRLMLTLGMTSEDKRKRLFAKLAAELNEGRAVAKGTGTKRFESQPNAMEAAARHASLLYDTFHAMRTARPQREIEPLELQYLRPAAAAAAALANAAAAAAATNSKGVSRANTAAASGTAAAVAAAMDAASGDQKYASGSLGAGISAEIDEYSSNPNFIREMSADVAIDLDLVALRTLEVLEYALAGRFLTCVQLALLVNRFPRVDNTTTTASATAIAVTAPATTDFFSFRVELVVSLFSKLTDLVNFDFVLKELDNVEFAQVIFRLGWLNIWNPLKAEGHLQLDLSRREERQLVRILVLLNFSEDGPTWQNQHFRPTPTADNIPNWELTMDWFAERTLPKQGVVKLHYFSGKGKHLMDCAPDPKVRIVLMALVLSQPYLADLWSEEKNTVANADALLDALGGRLSFRMERQAELEKLEGTPRFAGSSSASDIDSNSIPSDV